MLWNWYTIDSCKPSFLPSPPPPLGTHPARSTPNANHPPHTTGFLAESWHVTSNGAFAATCIGTILLVIAMEALRRAGKEYDAWILRTFQTRAAALEGSPSYTDPLLKVGSGSALGSGKGAAVAARLEPQTLVFRASPLQQAVRSVLHAVALGVAYIVMLLVMSYNGYVIICVLIGGGLGKFFCDWMTRRVVVSGGGVVRGEEGSGLVVDEPSVCCG